MDDGDSDPAVCLTDCSEADRAAGGGDQRACRLCSAVGNKNAVLSRGSWAVVSCLFLLSSVCI